MGNIIGEPLDGYVTNQIKARQTLHGSGVRFNFNERTSDQINILNSNTAWVKLASGVSISKDRLGNIGFNESEKSELDGMGLAEKYVLYAGVSSYSDNKLTQRQGFNPSFNDTENSSYIYSKNVNNSGNQGADMGFVPMPGIISMETKALNRGSLEKAFVKIKAHNKQQFDIIDVLYMRLGYTVLLEWGNSIYTDDGLNKKTVRNTIIEDKFFKLGSNRSYIDFLGGPSNPLIKSYKEKYSGNYDGMLAVISNFSWTFNPDGSYDIDLTLISLGDVIESLKTNISFDKSISSVIAGYTGGVDQAGNAIEKDKDSNSITAMLWLFKYFAEDTSKGITIHNPQAPTVGVGWFLKSGGATLSFTSITTEFTENPTFGGTPVTHVFTSANPDADADQRLIDRYNAITGGTATFLDIESDGIYRSIKNPPLTVRTGGPTGWTGGEYKVVQYKITGRSIVGSGGSNPIYGAPVTTAFVIKTDTRQYYLKFHYLLEYIKDNIIPLIKDDIGNTPLFTIDTNLYGNYMYSLPNQISLNPKVCLVRNGNFVKGKTTTGDLASAKVLNQLDPFRAEDYGQSNKNYAYPLNIYLNFEYITNALKSNQNERGDVNIYGFISTICTGINKSLGGINNLEPIIDKDTNTLKIIDSTPIPGISAPADSSYELIMYGYEGSKFKDANQSYTEYKSNFIRNIDLKTTVTPEYATMVTVGATANGYVKGTEATAFSVWNRGIVDRFKKELIPSNPSSRPAAGVEDEAVHNYKYSFLSKIAQCYGFDTYDVPFYAGQLHDFSDDIIAKNTSVVTEFYKYLIAEKGKTTHQAGTIGFIPFKLGITMDGISGIKIYNKLNVNSKFLPPRYGDTLNFIITGVSHKLQNNDWETNLETIVMPKTSKIESFDISYNTITNNVPTNNNVTSGTTYGVVGYSAVAPNLFPKALIQTQIESITTDAFGFPTLPVVVTTPTTVPSISTFADNQEIRHRIVKIALSYVGQLEYGNNAGYTDPEFETKMKGVGWYKTGAWCGFFQKLVWTEAYTTGNAIVPPAAQNIKDVWNAKAKNIPSSVPGDEEANSKRYSAWQPITTNQAYLRYVQPGDLAVFKSGHGEIVIKVYRDSAGKITKLDTVGGNSGDRVSYNKGTRLSSLKGFAQVIKP
jgi:hypothetical protein